MKKYIGVNRDKLALFQSAKMGTLKKKNRFKIAGREDIEINGNNYKLSRANYHKQPNHQHYSKFIQPITTITDLHQNSCHI